MNKGIELFQALLNNACVSDDAITLLKTIITGQLSGDDKTEFEDYVESQLTVSDSAYLDPDGK